MRREPATGSPGSRAASGDEVSSGEALPSPPSGSLQHLRCVGEPGQARLHAPPGHNRAAARAAQVPVFPLSHRGPVFRTAQGAPPSRPQAPTK
ncbi:hypothetical protein NDU88_003692 [Pleurodeles waltl]|uniref:Uncharacterized protein n=1 Tax=Pleurodeles waltl TaxID=8319 RepID=A0AAV7UZ54_PLEWA|nr:hypothetical protein NDU88_003692 [Pleurodeles waltl]